MKKKQTKKVVKKAWAVVENKDIAFGGIVEQAYDCMCQALTFRCVAVFKTRLEAGLYRTLSQKVIPIVITYNLV